MAKSKIKIPLLRPSKCSVIMAETKTGIILTIEGDYHTGTGEVFRIFDSYTKANEFCSIRINESKEFEYLIYDWKGKKLNYISPFDSK